MVYPLFYIVTQYTNTIKIYMSVIPLYVIRTGEISDFPSEAEGESTWESQSIM